MIFDLDIKKTQTVQKATPVFTSSENVVILEPETGAAEIAADQLWDAICKVTGAAVNWAKAKNVKLLTMGISCQRNTGTNLIVPEKQFIYLLNV